tara:strand:+ start:244 stop:588 length:345 start_codon:yes stop_codon:yes gene_type:complete
MRPISVGKNLVASVKTTIYQIPKGHFAEWLLLYVSNANGVNKEVTVWWYDKTANTEVLIIDRYPLTSSQFLKFDSSAYVVLEEGDEIRILTEAGSVMSCVNTFNIFASNTSPLV